MLFQNYSQCFSNAQSAPQQFNLTNAKYRSLNGVGNNPKYPDRGSSFTAYGRQHYAQYDDKIYAIRKSGRGYDLPSPRNIVRKIFLNDKRNLNKFSGRKNVPNMAAIMFAQLIKIDTGSRQIGQYMDGGNGEFNFNF
jgi:Animal haem peroxidase